MNRHNDKGIKDLVNGFIDHYKLRPKYYEYKIKSYWTEEMSPLANRYTTQIRIKDNKLFVHISSASVKHELTLGREKIKNNINEFLEEEYLEEVILM